MRLRGSRDEAGSQAIGLIIASLVIMGGFAYAKSIASLPAAIDGRSAARTNEAASALEILVRDPGATSSGSLWPLDSDHLSRMGLALRGQPNFIDYRGITSLRNGTLATTTNGAPDYPDVKAAIGLTGTDFHLRSYPVLPKVDDARFVKDTNGRLAYIGQYQGATAPMHLSVSHTRSATDLNVTTTVCNDGNIAGIFVVDFTARHNGNLVHSTTQEANTLLLAPGACQLVYADFNKLTNWHSDVSQIEVDVTDPYGNPAKDASGARVGPITIDDVPPDGGGADAYAAYTSAADRYVVQGNQVKFVVYTLDGKGQRPASSQARFVLTGPDGHEWRNSTVTLNSSTDYMVVCHNCTATGTYTGVVWDTGLKWRKMDTVQVTPTVLFTEKSVASANANSEIASLSRLVATFSTTRYAAATNPGGDVFGDDFNGAGDLTALFARYTTVVVGSEISQNSLLAPSFRNALRDWVQAGGVLIVLGTNTQDSRWLSDVYLAAQTTASGGITAPDATHPVLVTPNVLAYSRYLDRGRAWSIATDQPFTHVLTRGVVGATSDDTLAVANPGSLGSGTVVLTSYMPAQLTSPQDDDEETRLFQNLLAQRYNMLYLDYGPQIPAGVPVGSSERLAAVPHPNVPGAVVEVRLVMYIFG